MRTLEYIPALVAFVAALIAVVGAPKWDTAKRGFGRPTITGRAVIALATVALLASLGLTWRAQQRADFQQLQRDRITVVAHTELRLALRQLTGNFTEAFRDRGEAPPEFGLVPKDVLDPTKRAALAARDLRANGMWMLFQIPAVAASEQIDKAVSAK